MAVEVRSFAVTVPAGTLASAPAITNLTMPARLVISVRVRIPPGPRGEVGWALGAAGTKVIPWNAGAWIVADDEAIDIPLTDQIESGAWQLIAYNTGAYAHTLQVTFQLALVQSGSGGFLVPVSVSPE